MSRSLKVKSETRLKRISKMARNWLLPLFPRMSIYTGHLFICTHWHCSMGEEHALAGKSHFLSRAFHGLTSINYSQGSRWQQVNLYTYLFALCAISSLLHFDTFYFALIQAMEVSGFGKSDGARHFLGSERVSPIAHPMYCILHDHIL